MMASGEKYTLNVVGMEDARERSVYGACVFCTLIGTGGQAPGKEITRLGAVLTEKSQVATRRLPEE